ncbi:MAG TPA: hypothetical protein VFF69_12505 [Phycisphaerales bacterium]|nr:hypothetical protein [Phycisphaerales bacterium]
MPKRPSPVRHLWEDRFASPTVDGLLAALPPSAAPLITSLRAAIVSEHECLETLSWRGLPWRWTLSYRPAGARPDQDAVAHIVPNPAGPAVVFRLSREEFADLPVRKLSRPVRDGLAQAKLVAGISWPEWTVQSQAQVTDLAELFRMLRQSALAGA